MYRPCDICGELATERHHKFSQTRRNRDLYGALLDRPENIMHLCYNCHHNKPVVKLTEREFCDVLKIEPRGKVERWKRR